MHVDKNSGINQNQDKIDLQQPLAQKQQASVFGEGFYDKNGNDIIDADDFDNDITLIEELKRENIFGLKWSDFGNKVNEILNKLVKVPIESVLAQEEIEREHNEFSNYDYEGLIKNLKNIQQENKSDIINQLIKLSKNRKANSKLMELYNNTHRSELIDDINESTFLTKKEKETLLKSLMGVCYNLRHYNPFKLIIDNQVNNEHYQGKKYDIKYSGMIINITDKASNQIVRIDLETLFEENSQKAQKFMLRKWQRNQLPAEVLIDLKNEINKIKILGNNGVYSDGVHAGGTYSSGTEMETRLSSLIHELGHAIDSYKLNTPIIDEEGFTIFEKFRTTHSDFANTMRDEMDEYTKSGYKKCDIENITFIQKFAQIAPNNYCTESEQEMFAECYDLMMRGNNKSKNVIVKYFPKTFELAKKILEEQRSLPIEQRQ